MKKQLNVDAITNELRGNSAFFPRYEEKPTDDLVEQSAAVPKPGASQPVPQ